MSPELANTLHALLEQKCRELGEHFDAVQILCSNTEDNGQTTHIYKGMGNFYGRLGMAHDFITLDVASETARSLAQTLSGNQ